MYVLLYMYNKLEGIFQILLTCGYHAFQTICQADVRERNDHIVSYVSIKGKNNTVATSYITASSLLINYSTRINGDILIYFKPN